MLYNIHDILKVKSNLPGYIPDLFIHRNKTATDTCKDCDLIIHDLKSLPSSLTELASCTYYDFKANSVIYNTSLVGIRVAWILKNLEGKITEVQISKGYRIWSKFIKIPIGGILPVEIYLKTILHLKLLLKGHAFAMAGCVIPADSDCAILIAAPNAMGKTGVVMEFALKHAAKFVADDTVILSRSKDVVFSYPQPIRLRPKLKFNSLPFMEKYVAPETLFNINYSTRADSLFFLERANRNFGEEISHEAAIAKLTAINRKILAYQSENTIIWYLSSNLSLKLESLLNNERDVFSEFLKNKKCFVIHYTGLPSDAVKLIKKLHN